MALTRLISLLMLLLTSTLSWATSYIYVTNTTPEVVSVSSVQYGDKQLTKGTQWGTYDTVIPAYATRKILWMNRNTGITSGKYFYFDTTITANGSQVVLQQKLKGNLIGSSIWHSAKASSFSNPWFDDRNIHNNNFSYNNRNSVMSFKAEATSGYDDFYYVTHNNNHVEPVSSNANELKVLTYNLWTLIGAELKCERLKDVASAVKAYDVIVFEEAFENSCREQLMNDIRAEYHYQTRVVDNTSNILEDGGVIAVSRHPIAVEDQRVFPNCNGYICLSNRGFVYLEVIKNGVPYHV
ncbi:MAG TPA: phospholipase, partial [Agitococcus sp.]|nr:phospholipase [Agitococcus sp.]